MSIKVEAFSTPGCSNYDRERYNLRGVARGYGEHRVTWRDINVLAELDYAVDLGVLWPPSIAIDGELVFARLSSAAQLRQELERRLKRERPERLTAFNMVRTFAPHQHYVALWEQPMNID